MPIERPPKPPCVYILASKRDGVLYIGVTSNLADRLNLHEQDLVGGFSKKYGVHLLVCCEMHRTMPDAIRREKQLKKWHRAWKVGLIGRLNPEWRDLWLETGEVLMNSVGRSGAAEWERRENSAWRGSPPSRG
jgi:putative endonuclease